MFSLNVWNKDKDKTMTKMILSMKKLKDIWHMSMVNKKTLTKFSDFENLTQHLRQFNTTATKWTLVFILTTAVFQYNL